MVDLRPMTLDDVEAVASVVAAADEASERQEGREPEPPTEDQLRVMRDGTARFVERDPAGAWVAVRDGQVVGMTEAIRRGTFWGLSMLFVHPSAQSQGVGRLLLNAALTYAEGAETRMIMTSNDPRALRRYALTGLAIHPAVQGKGTVDRATIPAALPGRSGDHADLDLVEAVDAGLRGSRAEDVNFMVSTGARLDVIDGKDGRGYVVYRPDRVALLGATNERTAAALLWRALAESDDKAYVSCLTAEQHWAVEVALAARLPVVPTGPLFVSKGQRPPAPWVPNGWYF